MPTIKGQGLVQIRRMPDPGLISFVKKGVVFEIAKIMEQFIEWEEWCDDIYLYYTGSIKVEENSWISVDNILPEDNYEKKCMVRFMDGLETLSDCGTVWDHYRKSKRITHWSPL